MPARNPASARSPAKAPSKKRGPLPNGSRLYGVFTNGKWGMTTNKKEAISFARKVKGEVRSVSNRPGGPGAWDRNTFYASSMPVADFN